MFPATTIDFRLGALAIFTGFLIQTLFTGPAEEMDTLHMPGFNMATVAMETGRVADGDWKMISKNHIPFLHIHTEWDWSCHHHRNDASARIGSGIYHDTDGLGDGGGQGWMAHRSRHYGEADSGDGYGGGWNINEEYDK